jgi:hypothetical protein
MEAVTVERVLAAVEGLPPAAGPRTREGSPAAGR